MYIDLFQHIPGRKVLYTGSTVNKRLEFIGCKAFHLLL